MDRLKHVLYELNINSVQVMITKMLRPIGKPNMTSKTTATSANRVESYVSNE